MIDDFEDALPRRTTRHGRVKKGDVRDASCFRRRGSAPAVSFLSTGLTQDIFDDFTGLDTGELSIETLKLEGEGFGIDAELV